MQLILPNDESYPQGKYRRFALHTCAYQVRCCCPQQGWTVIQILKGARALGPWGLPLPGVLGGGELGRGLARLEG